MSTKISEGGTFTPPPEGTHIARCVRIIDLGTQPGSDLYPEPRHKVVLMWELPEETVTRDGEPKPALALQWYTASLHEKSKLRQHLHSWRGKAFTPEELQGFELKNVLGVPCQITIAHKPNGRAEVTAVTKLHKSMHCPAPVNTLVHYQIEDGENDVFAGMSPGMQAIIRKAQEWSGSGAGADDEPPPHDDSDIPF